MAFQPSWSNRSRRGNPTGPPPARPTRHSCAGPHLGLRPGRTGPPRAPGWREFRGLPTAVRDMPFAALQGRPGGAEPTVRAVSAGGSLPAVHLQAASDRAPFVLSCRASLKRCHPRFAPDRPGSGTAHPHPNRPHGHATPTRYPLRAGTKCSETFFDINDKFIRHDPVLGK